MVLLPLEMGNGKPIPYRTITPSLVQVKGEGQAAAWGRRPLTIVREVDHAASRHRRQAKGVDPCPGSILILLGGPTAAAHGAEKLAVSVDR
jgi:hypothetical protein